jgi:hypothetical protein
MDHVPMQMIRQRWDQPDITDIPARLADELERAGILCSLRPGAAIAISAGSRGIATMSQVLKGLVAIVAARGATPFVFPAMGSHGGGTAAGQVALLADLGVTEESMGCPIRASMEVEQVGRTAGGIPVYVDALAAKADGILLVNRIKKHTNFDAPIESGLCKMAVIGMGKHTQAVAVHKFGNEAFVQDLPEIARVALTRAPVLGGVALLENAWGGLAELVALPADQIVAREPALLARSKALCAKIPFSRVHLALVERMGKELSGTGMDCYVIGRKRIIGEPEWPETPSLSTLVVLDLTEASHGNGVGVGLADLTTRRLADKIDWGVTQANVMTSGNLERAKLPLAMATDRDAVEAAGFRERAVGDDDLTVVCLRDTLHLRELYVSTNLAHSPGVGVQWDLVGPEGRLAFDHDGNWLSPFAH